MIDQVDINTKDIENIKTTEKVRAGKIGLLSALGTALVFLTNFLIKLL
jgi:hypothetical protein